jgi:hypothetical protein
MGRGRSKSPSTREELEALNLQQLDARIARLKIFVSLSGRSAARRQGITSLAISEAVRETKFGIKAPDRPSRGRGTEGEYD